jgi:two-component system, OmpR family, phosphate regulon sensor histidine kinase PhoR
MSSGYLRMIGITSFVAVVITLSIVFALYFFGHNSSADSWHFLSNSLFWVFVFILLIFIFLMALWSYNVVNSIIDSSRMQREFVNNVTHEIKTPLSTILLATEALDSEEMQTNTLKREKYIAIIRAEGEKLKNELERVLEVSRLPKIGTYLKKELINPKDVLDEVLNSFQPIIDKLGVQLNVLWESKSQEPIYFDRKSMEIIFSNLVDNALKYNVNEIPKLTIRAFVSHKELNVCFEDNGLGISSEYIDQIFLRFYRVPISESHHRKGFGLGLYLVQQLLRAQDSLILVKSELGVGSQFIVRIPCKTKDYE